MKFEEVLKLIKGFHAQENVPFAVAGAFALHAYGISRATQDLDFITTEGIRERLISFLESKGYETLNKSEGFSNHLHSRPDWGRIDLIYVGQTTADLLLGSAVEIELMPGITAPVPIPEHLIALKLHAMRSDPGRRYQDLADLKLLLQLDSLDQEKAEVYFHQYGFPEEYRELREGQ